MIKDLAGLKKKLHALLSARFDIVMYDDGGFVIDDPISATRYTAPGLLVKVELPGDDQPSMSTGRITLKTNMDLANDSIVNSVRRLADDNLLIFHRSMFGKKKSQVASAVSDSDAGQLQRESNMNVIEGFGAWSGSSKTSYQPLDSVRIIVRHRKPVNEEVRGSRSRNIHSILIQHGPERFRLPENSLVAARAMARHLENGGNVYDSVGTQINEMATEYRQLKEFLRYVHSAKLVNEDNNNYVELAMETCNQIRRNFKMLTSPKGYSVAVESMASQEKITELNEDDGLQDKFVQSHLDKRVEDAFGSLRRASARRTAFEGIITKAIATETFDNLCDLLQETESMSFDSPHSQLSYQVSRLSQAASNETLKSHLSDISNKLSTGGQLGRFEYGTIKSCLLAANGSGQVRESKKR